MIKCDKTSELSLLNNWTKETVIYLLLWNLESEICCKDKKLLTVNFVCISIVSGHVFSRLPRNKIMQSIKKVFKYWGIFLPQYGSHHTNISTEVFFSDSHPHFICYSKLFFYFHIRQNEKPLKLWYLPNITTLAIFLLTRPFNNNNYIISTNNLNYRITSIIPWLCCLFLFTPKISWGFYF